jgi:hypothetical protein
MGRAYGLPMDNFSYDVLKKYLQKNIDEEARVKTDKRRGYLPLKKTHNIEQVASEIGTNFPELHILILNLKNWIRGIHHKISKNYFKRYLDEFFSLK